MRSVQEQIDAGSSWQLWGKYLVYVVSWFAFVCLNPFICF